jgi:hypothetical protein
VNNGGRDANGVIAATREAMSEAKLPIQYRDSCANLLIPLNRCRFETYYLPWKCEVCYTRREDMGNGGGLWEGKWMWANFITDGTTQL